MLGRVIGLEDPADPENETTMFSWNLFRRVSRGVYEPSSQDEGQNAVPPEMFKRRKFGENICNSHHLLEPPLSYHRFLRANRLRIAASLFAIL
jgi:hypothetical protein